MNTKSIQKLALFLTIMVLSFQSCEEKSKPQKIKPPKQIIDYEYAQELEEEYENTRGAIINKYLGIEDTREFWFDLEELKKYIAYVEQEADSLGYTRLGIRIYNGAYPKEKRFHDPGYSTVFLVPTGNKIKSNKASFSPISSTFVINDNIHEIPAYNYGHAGKPPKHVN
ncbi:hypothetical protein Q4Q34_18505 [Flavivirga abyssicola]|uniref:hypothetical protein n=1 Tax=Flavivirga abyssicola TaxID=3063533 RepID=UPI0026DEA9E0|nr:hypothetical protein [Flavivirga sp. MEBiC07777]WVK13208.1 hypothetical protein Q4Q34_18505 [Flavivirga sp. MEBiC07777]